MWLLFLKNKQIILLHHKPQLLLILLYTFTVKVIDTTAVFAAFLTGLSWLQFSHMKSQPFAAM